MHIGFNCKSQIKPQIYKVIYQKLFMKINFDQLFGDDKPHKSNSNLKKAIHQSQASTSYGMQQNFKTSQSYHDHKLINKKISTTPNQQVSDFKFYKKSVNQTMRVLQNTKGKDPVHNYLWYRQTKFDDEPSHQKKDLRINQKKHQGMSKKQISQMTNRLKNHSKCLKKSCKLIMDSAVIKRLKQQNPLGRPLSKRHGKNLTQISQYIKKNPSALHERLYQQHKSRQFRQKQLALQYSQRYHHNHKLRLFENPEYTSNYKSFYSRLDSQIDRRRRKQQFYDTHAVQNEKVLNFTPDISISQNSHRYVSRKASIIPRRQKNQLKGQAEMNMINRMFSSLDGSIYNSRQKSNTKSLNKSLQNILNRSVEIVQNKQQQFLSKIVNLFEQQGQFVMNPQKINQLNEIQFQIFFPLIAGMEKIESMPIGKFQDQLRRYFEAIPKNDKYALRNSQRERQKQAKVSARRAKQQDPNLKSSTNSKATGKSKPNQPHGDYLTKIQNFV